MFSKSTKLLTILGLCLIATPASWIVMRAKAQEHHEEREVEHRERLDAHLAELHEQIEARERQLAELHEVAERSDGNERELDEIAERRHQIERELEQLHQRHEAIIREAEGHRTEHARRHEEEPHDHEHRGPEEHAVARIHALHEAAERLAQAGMGDMAHELHRRAEELESELHRPERPEPGHELHEMLHHLVESNHQLREEVRELHHRLDHVTALLEELHHSRIDEGEDAFEDEPEVREASVEFDIRLDLDQADEEAVELETRERDVRDDDDANDE